MKTIRILGIRGIPASHGGFETFAEKLSLYLTSCGWGVTVYCQINTHGKPYRDSWKGISRINIPIKRKGPLGTILFDLKSVIDACKSQDVCLVLGYNTAIFAILLRLKGVPVLMNMDGIEWMRAKWNFLAKLWFWVNEKLGCLFSNHLIADHPEIKRHLIKNLCYGEITVIPYGGDEVTSSNISIIKNFNLCAYEYFTVIARPEPENSILEIIAGFSLRPRGFKLVVLGEYSDLSKYHNLIRASASPEVIFLGPIYDKETLNALRFYCRGYVHGHQVGGTNPSLVEAMGAGNAIISHDNKFNRWVAGSGAIFFKDPMSIDQCFTRLINEPGLHLSLGAESRRLFLAAFTWEKVNESYLNLISRFLN